MFCLDICLCTMCVHCHRRPEEGFGSPGTGVIEGCEPHMGPEDGTWVLWRSTQCISSVLPFPFYSVQDPGFGIVLPKVKVSLSTSIKIIQIIPHSRAQRLGSWVILNPVKLRINIKHHSSTHCSLDTQVHHLIFRCILSNVYEYFACIYVCICTMCVYCVHRGQEWALDTLELKLLMVVSYCVGSGNQIWTLCKRNTC